MTGRMPRTTGRIGSSEGLSQIWIVALNNTSVRRKAYVRMYDLTCTPKRLVYNDCFSLHPFQTEMIIYPHIHTPLWEVQVAAYSKSVRFYTAGQDHEGRNLEGNTVLNADFKRFKT